MKLGVIGAGYVGLVSAVGFAAHGHRVRLAEADPDRLAKLRRGAVPFHEPDVAERMRDAVDAGLLTFHDSNGEVAATSEVVMLALPTPPRIDGSADTSVVAAVCAEIADVVAPDAVVVLKSTVPPGTTMAMRALLAERGCPAAVAANPEFLREGQALADFLAPSRIVLGCDDERAVAALERLHAGIPGPVLVTDPTSAELIKYASNAFLAVRVSFANEVAALSEATGADVADVLEGMGLDPRIGSHYLDPGPGYGGSCLPKDTRGLLAMGAALGLEVPLVEAAVTVNERQRARVVDMICEAAGGDLAGATVAFWGLSFKAGSDDVRESPAVDLAVRAHAAGAEVVAYDPEAAAVNHGIRRVEAAMDAVKEADVLVVATPWAEFREVDLADVLQVMRGAAIVDARNALDRHAAVAAGFAYFGVGWRSG